MLDDGDTIDEDGLEEVRIDWEKRDAGTARCDHGPVEHMVEEERKKMRGRT